MKVRQKLIYRLKATLSVSVKTNPLRACLSLLNRRHRLKLILLALLATVMVSSSIIAPLQQVYASTNTSSLAPGDAAKSFAYYQALRHCMDVGSYANSHMVVPVLGPWVQYTDMNQDNATSYEWFADRTGSVLSFNNNTTVGVINDAKDSGVTNCGGSSGKTWIAAAANLWGYTSGPQLLCDLGFTREVKGSVCADTPAGASNKFYAPDNATSRLDDFWKTTLASGSLDISSIAIGGEYRLYADSFQAACLPSSVSYTIQTFTAGSSSPTATTYTASSQGNDGNTNVHLYQGKDIKCQDLAAMINKPDSPAVLGYIQYLKTHGGTDTSNSYSNCAISPNDPKCNTIGSSASTCGSIVNNIGWIVCPVINAIGGLDDTMWGIVSALLTVSPIQSGDTANVIWSAFRSFANILLIIVFLVIVFSQLTSIGITNYGVKKMLPRLVIAAILINISFYIVQIAVDLSNIIGSSLYDLINGLANSTDKVPTWLDLINTITALGAGGAISVAGVSLLGGVESAFFIILPGMIAGLLGFLAAMVTLIFRQAIIPILAVLAPLAFVAYLLPNTEQWFKKWRSLFLSMLMLYPTAALLFGGVKLSAIMISGGNGGHNWWNNLIGLIMLGAPLFMLPFIARQGGPLLSKVSGGLNGLAGKLSKPVAGFAKPREELAKNKYLSASNSRNPFKQFALSNNRKNKLTQLKSSAYQAQQTAEFNKDLKENATKYTKGMPVGGVAESYIKGAAARAEAEELKSEMAPLASEIATQRATNPKFNLDDFLRDRALTGQTEMQRVAAMHHAAALGRDNIMRELVNSADSDVKRHAQEAISANAGALVGKAPDLVKPIDVAFNNVTGSDMAQFSTDTMATYMKYLGGLHAAATAPGATAKDADNLAVATSSFNSAVVDITKNTELQSKFNNASGKKIESTLATLPSAFQAYATSNLTGLAGIQPDGKIR